MSGGICVKKKIVTVILIAAVMISSVSLWYYTSYPVIGVSKMVSSKSDNFEKEFVKETIGVFSAGNGIIPDSPLQKRKLDEVWVWNNAVELELSDYVMEGGIALNIQVSGELEDGKTTLRYKGYIITDDGEKIDYLQEKTFDFKLCSEKRFFTDKL